MRVRERVYKSFHFFCGVGGTKLGEQKARALVGDTSARFESIGGVDFDEQACRDYEKVAGGRVLCADVHKLEPGALARFTGRRRPDAVFMSPPCKGNSRLLSAKRAAEPKYVEMNALMERALLLCWSTWDELPPLIFVENVPGITSRSKAMLDRCVKAAHAHGYVVDMGTHDCGEIGGLAEHRPRWFAVFRLASVMPHVIYQPRKQRVRACGEVIGPMPMPGDTDAGGPMHAVPRISWTNWKRLAAIPAGGDWRDLEGVVGAGLQRRDVHRRHAVQSFDSPTPAITGPGGHAVSAIADPRPFLCSPRAGAYRVLRWDQATGTVTGALSIDNGPAAVADPRIPYAIRWATAEEIAEAEANPDRPPPFIPIIIAADGTWHRPLTTLELAALQSLPIVDANGRPIVFDGNSHTRWRMAIGNAVPPDSATAIGEQFLLALLRSDLGVFALSSEPIWVAPTRDDVVHLAIVEAMGQA